MARHAIARIQNSAASGSTPQRLAGPLVGFLFPAYAMCAQAARDNQDRSKAARKLFELRSDRALTDEDGREIASNLTGFFKVLQEWARHSPDAGEVAEEPRHTKDNKKGGVLGQSVAAQEQNSVDQ